MPYQSLFELSYVALNVLDLEKQVVFYQFALGLEVLSREENQVSLGVGQTELVRLLKTKEGVPVSRVSGLYHLAILLPSREDLSAIFKHFITNQIPLVGGSDHGYSEALYLEDPEGNGIEIYRDLDQSRWDIQADGRIIGKTVALDERGLYDLTDFSGAYRMPEGSRMGHVHLQSPSSQATSRLYQNILPIADKFSIPTGAWLASGSYHHHLAVNEWAGPNLLKRQEGMQGLAYFTIIFNDETDYKIAVTKSQVAGLTVSLEDQQAWVSDRDGICMLLSY